MLYSTPDIVLQKFTRCQALSGHFRGLTVCWSLFLILFKSQGMLRFISEELFKDLLSLNEYISGNVMDYIRNKSYLASPFK
jgi:hypothetical protein